MNRSSRMTLVLLALAMIVAPAADAAKKKGKKKPATTVRVVTSQGSTSADGQVLTLTPTCPAGTLAVGGGFDSSVATEADGELTDLNIVTESRRSASRAWTVSVARQDAGPTTGPTLGVTAGVHCASARPVGPKSKKARAAKRGKRKKRPLSITEFVAQGPTVTAAANISTATAQCPAGRVLMSGGFSATPTPVLTGGGSSLSFPIVTGSFPIGSAWVAEEETFDQRPGAVTSYAYCARGIKAPTVIQLSAPVRALAPETEVLSPACGKRALAAGGFRMPSPDGLFFGLIVDSFGLGTQWRASTFNAEDGAGTITAFGSCL